MSQKSRSLGLDVNLGRDSLGGGNSNIVYFHHYLGKIPNLTSIFFKEVGSTTNQFKVARFVSLYPFRKQAVTDWYQKRIYINIGETRVWLFFFRGPNLQP